MLVLLVNGETEKYSKVATRILEFMNTSAERIERFHRVWFYHLYRCSVRFTPILQGGPHPELLNGFFSIMVHGVGVRKLLYGCKPSQRSWIRSQREETLVSCSFSWGEEPPVTCTVYIPKLVTQEFRDDLCQFSVETFDCEVHFTTRDSLQEVIR